MTFTIELNEREKILLEETLSERLKMLHEQIHKSETRAFRDMLKAEQTVLSGLIEKLGSAAESFRAQEGEHRIERGPIEKAS